MSKLENPASFEINGVELYHLNFDFGKGWLSNYWIARATLEQPNGLVAINQFRDTLKRITPRISLISQAYIDYAFEPFLIHKKGFSSAVFGFIMDANPVGLMFNSSHKQSLELLLDNQEIPEEFYAYWNDATNVTGYSAKLLLMFSAIEALVKKRNGKKDWDKVVEILGVELKDEIFCPRKGLRHRLVHGEYFHVNDSGKNYLLLVHKKVVQYFNSKILKASRISENVVNPQRNPFQNKRGATFIVEGVGGASQFNLVELLESYDGHKFLNPEKFCFAANQDLKGY